MLIFNLLTTIVDDDVKKDKSMVSYTNETLWMKQTKKVKKKKTQN